MDIEEILEEVRSALQSAASTGSSGGLQFFNVHNEHVCAELHTRDGKLARLIITSKEQMRMDEQCGHAMLSSMLDRGEEETKAMIATLSKDCSPEQKAYYQELALRLEADKK